jgi:general secretion pathway protein K
MSAVRCERGFALIAALWLLVALSAIGLEFSLQARDRRLAAANLLDEARARAAAEAGLEHAQARLTDRLRRAERLHGSADPRLLMDAWADVGHVFAGEVSYGDVRYRLVLRDANAVLNLNRASEDEIRALLAALRVDFLRADEIAQSIADWVDADDLVRGRGAEREYYLRRGDPVLPRNGPLVTLDELRHVRGMTPEIHTRMRPYVTLLGSGRINLNAADPVVLQTLPGIGDEAVAALLRLRRQGRRLGNLFELGQELSPTARAALQAELPRLLARTTMETREVEVHSEGSVQGGQLRVVLDALLVRSGGTTYTVWKRIE